MQGSEERRRGALLPALLLVIVAVTLLGHGALVLAQAQLDVSIVSRALLIARLSAEGGVVQAMADSSMWSAAEPLWRPRSVRQGLLGPFGRFQVSVTAIDSELALWEGTGAHVAHTGTYRVGRLAWRLAPVRRLAAAEAVVTSGGPLGTSAAAAVVGTDLNRPPLDWTGEDCAPFAESVAVAVPAGRLEPWAVLVVDSGAVPPLGLLDWAVLADRSRRIPPGVITPRPLEFAAVCRIELATNWGDPSRRGGCRDHYVLVTASDDLTLVDGGGQGVLVVDGSLRLEGASRFAGVVLVAGDLTLAQGARIDGLVRAGGSVSLSDSARIVGSGCAVLAALGRLAALRRPVAIPDGAWVSPLGPAN
ncbi:MAG: hypothetical protein BMS9Abin29_0594 [Gemmatimonadota bacterium]|nr:MAG: hypothetical protein BMS9Abin29_0594 [Gemmatimonadota bacterium]